VSKRESLLLLLLELLLVEGELITFQDVAVASASLSRTGGDAGQQTSAGELVLQVLVQLLGAGGMLGTHVTRLLLLLLGGITLALSELNTVMLGVPLLEGLGIDLDDGVLDEGLGSDHLVGDGVVDDIHDTHLAGAVLGSPRVVTSVQSQSAELLVGTSASDDADLLVAELGHGGRAAHLVLSLLLVHVDLTTGQSVLVAAVTSDTHFVLLQH